MPLFLIGELQTGELHGLCVWLLMDAQGYLWVQGHLGARRCNAEVPGGPSWSNS